ncbi:glycoside hydrolase family 3 C-terminal domain-containing protein [Cedecea neteri]|uniref:glycoside hydrolase family 3 C-terminal domain-containing protein n=1 Tax=Cedecea neteri TaxID=158822 RepID=UPI002AA94ECC|nr:glycoside hydrolase family 3 C-terminal domain-containing protein [Cedecea neteri]WPU25194.1 glycoside hydrolase family 3 C-terminal domain-containing protein [Cedecea neteri]
MNADFHAMLAAMTTNEKVTLLSGSGLWRTAALPQHGIPDIVMTDGTYGVRYSSAQIDGQEKWSMDDFISVITQTADRAGAVEGEQKGGSEGLFSTSLPATCFPNGSSLACSWDIELVQKMGQALGLECQQMGVGILLGPGINIRRTPLAGRGYEYYSEDPVVSGDIAAALINGLQAEGVGASLKHFAANNSEFRRTEMDSVIDERALREIYLAGFQRAIAKSNPWTVMSSYNRLNGVQTEIFALAGEAFTVSWAEGTPDDIHADAQALQEAITVAQNADVAVIFVSTAVGEDGENGDRQDLNILAVHEQLIREVAAVQPNVVVVLANSDAVVMPWLSECKALLETFFAGQGMGGAVAEILFGKRNPCGKLTVTVPNTIEETPAWLHYPGENLQHHYSEGLFVGYRYYDKRRLKPLFPFGFGLSYTRFAYHRIELSAERLGDNETLTVSVDVTNCGKYAGKEIVQLYVRAPKGELIREEQALKAFSKISLEPGETRRVSLQLPIAELSCYHPGLAKWLITPGRWQVYVGGSSRDLPLSAGFDVDCEEQYMTLRDDNSLQQLIQQPEVFARVVALVAGKSGVPPEIVREKLTRIAPDLFCGLLIALTEFLGLDIERDELNAVLAGEQ